MLWPNIILIITYLFPLELVGGEMEKFIDTNGYLLYCPCMGRFGNQMDHLLGSFAFAHALNRTLIIPPLVEYPAGSMEAKMVDFERYFEVDALQKFHRVISARKFFLSNLSGEIWPPEERSVLCWAPHYGIYDKSAFGCLATEGNPPGPFWQHLNVTFTKDLYYGDIVGGREYTDQRTIIKWKADFPPSQHPVLAFSAAPAAFPALPAHQPLQRFLRWSADVRRRATEFRTRHLLRPYIGVHLRTDTDWIAVCGRLDEEYPSDNAIFASAQCTGYANEHGRLTREMCLPSMGTIVSEIAGKVQEFGAKSIFVSSDRHFYLDKINEHLRQIDGMNTTVRAVRLGPVDDVHVSLALLGMSDHFIGNCVSTFSAFVVRQRKFQFVVEKSTSFFGHRPKIKYGEEL